MPRNNRCHPLATSLQNLGRRIAAEILPPSPSPTPSRKDARFFALICLQALIMMLVITLFFIFVGVAAIVLIHLFIAGHRREARRPVPAYRGFPYGYSPEELKTLPKTRFRGSAMCPICLDDLSEGEFCRVLPSCEHTFHLNCIDRWLKKVAACPICRRPVKLPESAVKRTAVIEWELSWSRY